MFRNTTHTYNLTLIVLFLSAILQISCECKNQYVGKGEVTEVMIEEIKEATEEYIKKHPELNTESKTKFNLLLETLTKLQKGQETDIPMEVVDAAAELGQPDIVQALIDIITRDIQDKQLEQELHAKLQIAKEHFENKNKKLEEARWKKEFEEARRNRKIEEAEKQKKKKEEKEKNKLERKKLEENRLQHMIERRLAFEKAGDTIQNGKEFIANYRISNVEDIKEFFEYVKERLTNSTNEPLSKEQQEDIRSILKDINKETKEIIETLGNITYGIKNPGILQETQYKPEHLELANKLLEDLKNYKEQLRKLLAERGKHLADYEDEPEIETEAEKIAYRELEELINDPSDTPKLAAHSKQEMQILLNRMGENDAKRKELEQEALQAATKVEETLELFKNKKRAIEKLYFNSDTKDYVNRPIDEGIQKIKMLQEAIDTLNKSVRHFCKQCIISLPHIPTIPAITKKELQWAFKSLVDQLVPDSRLVKATLNSQPLPQTSGAWADLGLKSGFDFIPYGKELKLLAGPDKPVLQKKIKDLLVKLIEKRALKA